MISNSINTFFNFCQKFKPATEPLEREISAESLEDMSNNTFFSNLHLDELANAVTSNNREQVQGFFNRFKSLDFKSTPHQINAINWITQELGRLNNSSLSHEQRAVLVETSALFAEFCQQTSSFTKPYIETLNKIIQTRNLEKTTRPFLLRIVYKGNDLNCSLNEIFWNNLAYTMIAAFTLQALSDPRLLLNPSRIGEQISAITDIPENIFFRVQIICASYLALKILRIEDSGVKKEFPNITADSNKPVSNLKTYALTAAVQELYYRAVIQGSLVSLAQFAGIEMSTANFYARLTASVMFGVAHARQSLAQAIYETIGGYYINGRLYAEKGLLAATIAHFSNNIITNTAIATLNHLRRACTKPGRKEHLHAA